MTTPSSHSSHSQNAPALGDIKRIQTKLVVNEQFSGVKLYDFLFQSITPGLSKAIWKKCITAGGVWLKQGNQKKRVKRVTALVQTGEHYEVFFDPKAILSEGVSDKLGIKKIYHKDQLSCWYKPANILTQNSPYGDQTSLQSYVTKVISPSAAYLIHRLDRETEGLVLFAHSKNMAAKCNYVFAEHLIQKSYVALVVGSNTFPSLQSLDDEQKIESKIDGKDAVTIMKKVNDWEVQKLYELFPETKNFLATWVKLLPITGRKHQLRIHMQQIGRPLLHDPRYSRTHKKGTRLYLMAYGIFSKELEIDINVLK